MTSKELELSHYWIDAVLFLGNPYFWGVRTGLGLVSVIPRVKKNMTDWILIPILKSPIRFSHGTRAGLLYESTPILSRGNSI